MDWNHVILSKRDLPLERVKAFEVKYKRMIYIIDIIKHIMFFLHFTDINECATNNGGCSHMCENTYGDYKCVCNDGYVLHSDLHTCLGKNCMQGKLDMGTLKLFP